MSIELRHWMARNRLQLSGSIPELHHRVEPGDDFQVPRAFIALYQGGPDDAGWVTQRFVEEVLAKPVQDPRFPYVSWDSWAYGQAIDEKRLRESAETAARAGVELFIVDLGWANSIGDWHADPAKFPSGLRALSDHVHTLGMKFGLHFAWSHASPNSPVLRGHPDWVASRDSLYYGASSLCLGHKPVREWIVSETLRMIDEYGVDWILQDGENMVKHCQSRSHTHHPDDSNYANSVDGLDAVLREVQKARPHVLWENCENGGNMMTYQMVQQYVTSIVNDASGARASRLAVYGATFPFPPRYTDRYMPEQRIDAYTARSYEFGGPWILMNRLAQLDPQSRAYLTREIERYKQARSFIRDAKVLHLTGPPAEGGIDAIAAHDPSIDTVIAFVTRDGGPLSDFALRVGSLDPERTYLVRFADDGRALTLTGVQIGSQGINVLLPEERYSEVVYIAPLETAPRLFDSRGPR
jgi:alpha-galactosidase